MPTLNKPKHTPRTPYKKDSRYSKLYNTTQWSSLRDYYLHLHPLCENCMKNNKVSPATEVHHKQFLSTDPQREWELLLDENNLMSLCTSCHHRFHNYANANHLKYVDFVKLTNQIESE